MDDPLLPTWLRSARPVTDPRWRPYLDARAELIRRRVDCLVHTAAAERPAWTAHFGAEPADPAEHETWLSHIAAMAAYRDQYQVADDDPEHPLGPYPESGRVGHRAYWIAAASLLALRGANPTADPSRGRLAADRYRTLDIEEQERIAAELAEQLGRDWLGDSREPAADADEPVYRQQLAAILVAHGRLDIAEPGHIGGRVPRTPSARARAKQRHSRSVQAGQHQTPRIQTELPYRQPNTQAQSLPQPTQRGPSGPAPGL